MTESDVQAARWDRARRFWLGTTVSMNTRRAYEWALRDFRSFAFSHCSGLGEVGGETVSAYVAELRTRGCSEATIRARLAALSSFYEYCMTQYSDSMGKGLAQINPVAAIKRPRVELYGNSRPLEPDEARVLLAAIDRSTVIGMRDYAMILMALYTGRRSAEIRDLRWGDIAYTTDGRCRYVWRGKGGKGRWDDMPAPVLAAIKLYLEAAGRWPIEAGDPVFIAHNGHNGLGALTGEWLNGMVKGYAAKAGLGDWVHAHTLRHTAAHLRVVAGRGLQEISMLLGHSSLRVTEIYLRRQRGFVDDGWVAVEQLISEREGE